MQCAMWHSNLPIARLILSAKGDNTAASVFNHEHALFFAKSSKMVEWALDSCMEEAPEKSLGGLNLVSVGAGTLLHCCDAGGLRDEFRVSTVSFVSYVGWEYCESGA